MRSRRNIFTLFQTRQWLLRCTSTFLFHSSPPLFNSAGAVCSAALSLCCSVRRGGIGRKELRLFNCVSNDASVRLDCVKARSMYESKLAVNFKHWLANILIVQYSVFIVNFLHPLVIMKHAFCTSMAWIVMEIRQRHFTTFFICRVRLSAILYFATRDFAREEPWQADSYVFALVPTFFGRIYVSLLSFNKCAQSGH